MPPFSGLKVAFYKPKSRLLEYASGKTVINTTDISG